jgi:hypothetical protein
MDLEQRIQALEQEVQILKNQIQATLLDVQEQLLTNAYPSLIAADSSPSNDTGQSFNPPQRQYLHTVAPEDSTEEDASASPMNVRRVSLNDLQGTPAPEGRHSQATETSPEFRPTPTPTQPIQSADWSTLTELEDWVSNKVEKMGVERTRKLVHMYAEKGHFAPDVAESLFEIVSLYDRPSRKPASNHHNNGNHHSGTSTSQRAKPSREAQRPKARSSRPAGRPTVQRSQPRPQPAPQRNYQPAPRPNNGREQITRSEATITNDDSYMIDEQEQSQNLVLRLIAGVQNAGAGVKWSKKHG